MKPVEEKNLNDAQKQSVKGRPVFDIRVMTGKETLSDPGGGITLQAPYTLKDGRNCGLLC